MPQLQVVNTTRDKPDPTGVSEFFSKLSKDYKERQDQDVISNILSKYEENQQEANAWEKSYLELQKSNLSPSKRLQAEAALKEVRKVIVEKDKALNQQYKALQNQAESKQILLNAKVPEEEAEEMSKTLSPASARAEAKNRQPKEIKPVPKTEFEKTYSKEEAKKLSKYEDDILKYRDSLSNLKKIESLAENELSGVKGYLKSAIGAESAKEMSNLSFAAIEPILKLFNPVGAIPTQKIKIIQQEFQMHPSDRLTTIKGKINALERLGKQALGRAEERVALIKKYKGEVPSEELKNFDDQSNQLSDVLIDEQIFENKIKDKKENDLIYNLYSSKDGRKLKPIPLKEAKKLYSEGLITNVPRE